MKVTEKPADPVDAEVRHFTEDRAVVTPETAMRESAEKLGAGERVAILFGPERAGLENDDIARADTIISVPVDPAFPSLNLAQCVLLTAYEWRRAQGEVTHERIDMGRTDWADAGDVEALASHYEDQLEEAGFFFPEHKAAHMRRNLRNLWSRMPLTRADVQMMHGILRQVVRWARQKED